MKNKYLAFLFASLALVFSTASAYAQGASGENPPTKPVTVENTVGVNVLNQPTVDVGNTVGVDVLNQPTVDVGNTVDVDVKSLPPAAAVGLRASEGPWLRQVSFGCGGGDSCSVPVISGELISVSITLEGRPSAAVCIATASVGFTNGPIVVNSVAVARHASVERLSNENFALPVPIKLDNSFVSLSVTSFENDCAGVVIFNIITPGS